LSPIFQSGSGRRGNMGATAVMVRLGLAAADGMAAATPRSQGQGSAPAPSRGRKRASRDDDPPAQVPPSLQAFSDFRRACQQAQGAWEQVLAETSIARIGAGVEAIVNDILLGAVPARRGYVRKTVLRKLIFACPAAHSAEDWHVVTRADLQRWAPDEADVLGGFPETESADSMSVLVFDRPDWGLLISLWACLCNPALPVIGKAGLRPESLQEADAKAIAGAAAALHSEADNETTVAAAVNRWLRERGEA